jgi:hypothetical protein
MTRPRPKWFLFTALFTRTAGLLLALILLILMIICKAQRAPSGDVLVVLPVVLRSFFLLSTLLTQNVPLR